MGDNLNITRMLGEHANRIEIECSLLMAEKYIGLLKKSLSQYDNYKTRATFDISTFVAAKIGAEEFTMTSDDADLLEPIRSQIVDKRQDYSTLKVDIMISENIINKMKINLDIPLLEASLECIRDDVSELRVIVENSNGSKFNNDLIKSFDKFPELGAKLNLYGTATLIDHIIGLNMRANKIMNRLEEMQNYKINLSLSEIACNTLGLKYNDPETESLQMQKPNEVQDTIQ